MAMVMDLQAHNPPNLVISPSSVNLTVQSYVNVSVMDPTTKTNKSAFSIGLVRNGIDT